MFDWIEEHKKSVIVGTIISLFILVFVIPLAINGLFKISSGRIFAAEWTAGELLLFYGSVLTFISTVGLSALALWQNKTIRDEVNKREDLIKEMEFEKNSPHFSCKSGRSGGKAASLHIIISNVSENIAHGIVMDKVKIFSESGASYWVSSKEYKIDALPGNNNMTFGLGNPPLKEGSESFCFSLKCKDRFGRYHAFDVVGKCESVNSHPEFTVTKAPLPLGD